MEEIKKMLLDFMVTEENLFVHYSEVPAQFEDDLSFIGSIDESYEHPE